MLRHVMHLLAERQYVVGNADVTIVAQRPRLAPYISQMIHVVATAMGVAEEQLSIKATTTDGLGFTGIEAGIASYAVCLVQRQGTESTS